MGKNITAFALDDSVAESAPPDGAVVAGLPGRWKKDDVVLPEAVGHTVESLRTAIAEFGIPLKEVEADEDDALAEFEPSPELMESRAVGIYVPETEPEAEQVPAEPDKPDTGKRFGKKDEEADE